MPANFWTRYAVALTIVAALLVALYALARTMRHAKMPRRRKRLRVLDTATLSPHASLAIVQASDRVFVIGVTDSSVSPIAELSEGKSHALQELRRNEIVGSVHHHYRNGGNPQRLRG